MATSDIRIVGQIGATVLQRRTVRLPAGRTKDTAVVDRPDAVGVVVLPPAPAGGVETLLVRQPRPAVDDPALVEIVAGKVDSDEHDPVDAGRRELAEEAGLAATTWHMLAPALLPSPGYTTERITLLCCWDTTEVARRPEDAHIVSEWVDLRQALTRIGDDIRDMKTIIGLHLAAAGLENGAIS